MSNTNEILREPLSKKEEQGNEERRKILKSLDEKIVEVISFLNDKNLKRAETAGVSNEIKNKMWIIRKNISKLIFLIDNSEMKMINYSHFCDRLGNFSACLGLAERIIKRKKEGIVGQELISKFEDKIIYYHKFFSRCVIDEKFLREELETVEGAKMH